jgi:hypothetical protein
MISMQSAVAADEGNHGLGSVSIVGVLASNADIDQFDVVLNAGEVYDFWMGPDTFVPNDIDDAALQLDVSPGGPQVAFDDDTGLNATFVFSSSSGGTFRLTAEEVLNGGSFELFFVNKSRELDISDHVAGTTTTLNPGVDQYDIDGVGTNAVLAEEDVLNSSIVNRHGVDATDRDPRGACPG